MLEEVVASGQCNSSRQQLIINVQDGSRQQSVTNCGVHVTNATTVLHMSACSACKL